jgi:hypothetical protein
MVIVFLAVERETTIDVHGKPSTIHEDRRLLACTIPVRGIVERLT